MPSLPGDVLRLEGKLNVALDRQPVEQPGVLEDITNPWCRTGRAGLMKNLDRAAFIGLVGLNAGDDV